MKQRITQILLSFLVMTGIVQAEATVANESLPASTSNAIQWNAAGDKDAQFPSIPDEYGFAGGYAGVVGAGEDRWLVFGGGANFPYENPFDDAKNANNGQPKAWYKSLYAIQLKPEGLKPAEGAAWEKLDITLPENLGYGGSVTLKSAKAAVFLGGDTGTKKKGKGVYQVTRENKKFALTKVTELPVAVGNVSANIIGDKIYVISGASEDGPVQKAWSLDAGLKEGSTSERKWEWKEIAWPEFAKGEPADARVHYTLGVQSKNLYLFGGRTITKLTEPVSSQVNPSDVAVLNDEIRMEVYRDCYKYNPKKDAWSRIADLPKGITAAPNKAVPAGVTHMVLLAGGDAAGKRYQMSDEAREKYGLNAGGQGFKNPGFARDIYAYHAITDSWVILGAYPEGVQVPVTAPVVIDGEPTDGYEFLVVSGEWSPKLRTTAVTGGLLRTKGASFGIINWIVVVVYLLGMVGIGYWFMMKESAASTDDYFRGGQRIPWWVAGLSIFATVLSSITFMAVPSLSYAGGWNRWIGQWPIIIIIPLVVFAFLPFYRKLNITSAYEYLEARFNLAIRLIASFSFMIFHVGRIAIVLYLPALALSSVSDIPIVLAIVVIGILCVIYTVMGGIEAVVWTDAIQALVLIGGAILCFVLVVFNVEGGFGAITETLQNKDKFLSQDWSFEAAKDISSSNNSGWLTFFGFLFAALPNYTSGQDVVQRYVTTPTEKEAARSLWMNIFMTLVGSAVFFALGTALYVFYNANPASVDPTLPATDGILPFFIMQNLPIGVSGLIVAGVFAAAQSTISSSLNSLATAFVTDVYGRVIAPESPDQKRLSVARNIVIGVGIVGISVSIWIAKQEMKSAYDTFNMFVGFVLGPLAAMFCLGIFTKRVSGAACLIGALCGSAAIITVTFLNKAETIDVWSLLNGLICFAVTFIVGLLASLVLPAKAEEVKGLTIWSKGS